MTTAPGLPVLAIRNASDQERVADRGGDIVRVFYEVVVLHYRQRDAGGVGLLEGVSADHVRADLSRDRDHRHRVHVGRRYAGHQVARAGAARGHADANLAGRPRVSVGRVRGSLLVAR